LAPSGAADTVRVPVRQLVIAGLAALLLAALSAPAATPAPAPDAQALLRVAGKLSGLSVRRAVPVVVEAPARYRKRQVAALERVHPRRAQAHDEAVLHALGLTTRRGVLHGALLAKRAQPALYDPGSRRVHVQRRTTPRGAVLQELVHALQDQHFRVSRARALAGDRDASLAAAAAIEGHASLVAGVLASRRLAAHGGPRLDAFLELQVGFVGTIGRRLALGLRNLGGNRAVFSALRRFPATTEQVFHLDKFLERERPLPVALPVEAAGLRLVSENTFGELDVRSLLAVFAVPRLDRAAAGWGGGRSAVYRSGKREAVAVALEWDTELDAEQWADAVGGYVGAAFRGATATECEATACWTSRGRGIAFAREGARTVLVVSGDSATAARVARTLVPALVPEAST
jgi:hypothetical protein